MQNANNVTITAGAITGLSLLGLSNGAHWQPSLYPDLVWGLVDNSGNFGAWLDTAATFWGYGFNFNTGTIGALNAATLGVTVVNAATISNTVLNSATVALTGGTISGMQSVGISNTDSMVASLYPDWVWGVADRSHNIGLWLDVTATLRGVNLNFNTGTITNLSLGGPLAASTIVGQTIALNDVTLMPSGAPLPDMYLPVVDANRNIASYYGGDGYFHAAGVDANTLLIGGVPVATSSVPVDAIDVTAPAYGAVGDAMESYGNVTITGGTTVSVVNFTGPITLAQQSATTALLTIGPTQRCWRRAATL